MIILKIYLFIAVIFYILMGAILIKRRDAKPLSLISLIIVSFFWLPVTVYAILTYQEGR